MLSSPLSKIGITFKVAPEISQHICQGTMLEWCSNSETITSLPLFSKVRNPFATRFIESVVPLVKMIS